MTQPQRLTPEEIEEIRNCKCSNCAIEKEYFENNLLGHTKYQLLSHIEAVESENEVMKDLLQQVLDLPRWVDRATVPQAGIDAAPNQVVFNFSMSYARILKIQEVLK